MAADQPSTVLYLVRHSKAEEHHPKGDRYRTLSSEGKWRIETMIPMAGLKEFRADLFLSSPYPRAVETRDQFATTQRHPRLETSAVLTPSGNPEEALAELETWVETGYSRIAVFTHNPFVTAFAEFLLVPGSLPDLVFHAPSILALGFDHGLQRR